MPTAECLLALLLALPHAPGPDRANFNTLTPQEIADGWVLLFDGETTFGWSITGDAQVKDGVLILGRKKPTTAQLTLGHCEVRFEFAQPFGNEFSFELMPCRSPGSGGGSGLREDQKSDTLVWHEFLFRVSPGEGGAGSGEVQPKDPNVPPPGKTWRAEIFLSSLPASGGFQVKAGHMLHLRRVRMRPLGMKPLFNGKDLTGWKEFPGKKSKFIVTKEGWLNVKDGPGDLQTVGQYDDFVLQLDCRSNGKHLNSGVFFRCRPGEYQQGYEAQIHNGFDPAKPKDYVIEEYDPKTNELKGKKTIQSPALDYGTGGIYRRVPARKQMSKDGEWFTMTVVAHGRHIATWVNGVQVVDWTDHRPLKDNARQGCRLEKGCISLQGHDPTTNLDFRNIRIAELPKK